MFEVKEMDPVLLAVKKVIRQLGFASDAPLGQQILLLGDAFYGYRFTGKDVTVVWSATDQTLTAFDQHGKRLADVTKGRPVEGQETIRLPEPAETRKVA